jgi:predicted transcriptional regulator
MAQRRKLSKDITQAELIHMRDERGMSVAEIAQMLGVSRPTIYNYLRFGFNSCRREKNVPDGSGHVFDAAHSLTRLQAADRTYDIDQYKQELRFMSGEINLLLSPDDIHRMINELTYIERVMKKWRDEHNDLC